MLISVVQQSGSAKHTYTLFHIFIIIVYYRILNTVPKPNHFLIRNLSLSFLWHAGSFQPGIRPVPSSEEVWNLNHWTAREFPGTSPFIFELMIFPRHPKS